VTPGTQFVALCDDCYSVPASLRVRRM
jgi:hypothetical protein